MGAGTCILSFFCAQVGAKKGTLPSISLSSLRYFLSRWCFSSPSSSILSFSHMFFLIVTVYSIEASDLADKAKVLVADNGFADRIVVIKGKVEDAELPEKVHLIFVIVTSPKATNGKFLMA